MSLRHLSITVAALVVLSAAVWFARRPTGPAATDPRVGQPVLAPGIAAQVARVTLTDQGRTVELLRSADDSWTVESYHGFPADFTKLSRLFTELGDARIRRLATARADRLERLEFKDTSIALSDAEGGEIWKLTLGKTAEGGGRFIRYGQEEKGYLAPLSLWLDSEPKSWADQTLLDLKAGDIRSVEIGFTRDAFPAVHATRAKPEETWTADAAPEGKRLKPDRVNAALTGLLTLRFNDTAAPDDEKAAAARAHARTFRLTTFDGRTFTVTFARTPEQKVLAAPKPEEGTPAAPRTESGEETPPSEPKTPDIIPAGPVFVSVTSSEASARINQMMQRRAFQVGEWTYTGLPASADEFWEPLPAPSETGVSGSPVEAPPGK